MVSEKIYISPTNISEAIVAAQNNAGNFKYIAGGTDVIINQYQGNEKSGCLIDISKIEELKKVIIENNYLKIGALVKLNELNRYPQIKKEIPGLIEAALAVGSPLIRKTATIGGNLLCENRCIFYNQSEWWREAAGNCLKCGGDICIATGGKKACFSKAVSDTAPALLSMNSKLEVEDNKGISLLDLEDIYTGDGINPLKLNPASIIKAILVPINHGYRTVFKKLRHRKSLEFTSLTTAVTIDKLNNIKLVIGGVDPKYVVISGKRENNAQLLIKDAIKQSKVVDNDMFSRTYRKEMIKVFLEKSFEELKI